MDSTLPGDADHAQRGASDPQASVWVAASAGTGKTKVLIDRVLRLMLAGTDPRRILCLTYTKAAAAEMANRLAERLGSWAVVGSGALDRALIELLGRETDDAQRTRARALFARVLDTPGGLNIQTIHAFCQSLLGRFPLEAGVPPNFSVLEERDARDLLTVARHDLLQTAERAGGSLAHALATITRHLHEAGFAELMREITEKPERMTALIKAHGSVQAAAAAARAALGLASGETPQDVMATGCADCGFDADALRRAAEALAAGSGRECERAGTLAAWLAADPVRRAETFEAYARLFLTKDDKGELPKLLANRYLAARKCEARAPGTLRAMQAEGERLL
jgi:ATP-dependent helicase/nuclease subunit A